MAALQSALLSLADRVVLAPRSARSTAGKVDAVVVAHSPQDAQRTVHLVHRQLRGCEAHKLVVVANSSTAARRTLYKLHPSDRLIRGSNKKQEFSGYAEGLEVFADDRAPLLVVNDRASVYSRRALRLVSPPVLDLVREHQLVVGQIDGVTDPLPFSGERIQTWIRSNFFIAPSGARSLFRAVAAIDFEARIPPEWPGPRWQDTIDIENQYLQHLLQWLTLEVPAQAKWYGAAHVDAEYWPTFRRKCLAIMREHVLTQKMLVSGLTLLRPKHAALLAKLNPEEASAEIADIRNLPAGHLLTNTERRNLLGAILSRNYRAKAARP